MKKFGGTGGTICIGVSSRLPANPNKIKGGRQKTATTARKAPLDLAPAFLEGGYPYSYPYCEGACRGGLPSRHPAPPIAPA